MDFGVSNGKILCHFKSDKSGFGCSTSGRSQESEISLLDNGIKLSYPCVKTNQNGPTDHNEELRALYKKKVIQLTSL